MKIIHTSDWHIGQNFYRYDRDDEHQYFFEQLSEILACEQPDALVVSGDVFHNSAPSVTAQRLFVDGIIALHDAWPDTVIVITAGNHDSGSRLEAERPLWRRLGIHVVGSCMRNEDGSFDPSQFVVSLSGIGHILAIPYFHPSNYPRAHEDTPRDKRQAAFYQAVIDAVPKDGKPVVMMAHLAVDGCDTRGHEDFAIGGMLKESLADLGLGYDYLALGHIHMPQRIDARAYYCGTPLSVSFSEDYDHYVNLVEIAERGALASVRQIALKQKRKVKTVPPAGADLETALACFADVDANDDCYVRILVDQDEILPPDAEDRARLIAQDKKCRLCEVKRKARTLTPLDSPGHRIEDVEEVRRLQPLDIAKRCYLSRLGNEMPQSLIIKMELAISKSLSSETDSKVKEDKK